MSRLPGPAQAHAPSALPASPPKVHTTTIAVVPPAHVWRSIQALRCFRDKSFVRWPPHINLLYPFHPDDALGAPGAGRSGGRGGGGSSGGGGRAGAVAGGAFAGYAQRATEALAHVPPFRVRLEALRTFRHSARSFTLWAEPQALPPLQPPSSPAAAAAAADAPPTAANAGAAWSSEGGAGGGAAGAGDQGGEASSGAAAGAGGLLLVQSLLEGAFPACTDLSRDEARGIAGFVPHLSLGQMRELCSRWAPLEFTVDSVQLLSRRGYLSPFMVRYSVPLGSGLGLGLGLGPGSGLGSGSGLGLGLGRSVGGELAPEAAAVLGSHPPYAVRLDVPYLATMADPVWTVDGGWGGGAGVEAAQRLRRRFASPCQVLPPLPAAEPLAADTAVAAAQPADHVATAATAADAAAGPELSGAAAAPHAAAAGVKRAAEATPEAAEAEAEAGAEGLSEGGHAVSGGSDEEGGGGAEGHVWWFAYGAALQAPPEHLGALRSVAATALGHRLVFNRPGYRANLQAAAPTPGQQTPHAPSPPGATRRDVTGTDGRRPLQAEARDADAAGGGATSGGTEAEDGAGPPGVLHLVPLGTASRMLLATPEACPIEVRCIPRTASRPPGPPGHGPVAALALAAPPERCLAVEGAPPASYVSAVLKGARRYGLEPQLRSLLEGLGERDPRGAAAGAQGGPGAAPGAAPHAGLSTGTDAVTEAGLDGGRGADEAEAGGAGGEGAGAEGGGRGGRGGGRGGRRRGGRGRGGHQRTGADKAVAGLPRGLVDW
ncbi:hypothetical protein HYH03_005335 [Edaphochlamys debaryana]|uniref:Uncharacterized protein n=1 Tax=Edaphochlamys debaryana TaxID=47281 RepID=A0A836C135_9CHLO|nr:hypothetical protein HYH03_005335 [Edaphochlamys debaryana]|eukprot:KAG2496511.1 hypothetical protein HYH03_005335 [Edaphochlamys debaryana]